MSGDRFDGIREEVMRLIPSDLTISSIEFEGPLVALGLGIIPESQPQFIWIYLYASGLLPFSILLASSIVQDGHGALPLLAYSRKSFFMMKAVNLVFGLLVGVAGILLNF